MILLPQKRLVVFIMECVCALSAMAQPYCDVRVFSLEDGLAANTISDLDQAPDHLMWFGTWNGLCYYDGYHFSTFRDEVGDDLDFLSTNRIKYLHPNVFSDIWVITGDDHLYLFDTRSSEFHDVSSAVKEIYGFDFIADRVYPLKDSVTWISDSTNHAIIRVDEKTHTFTKETTIGYGDRFKMGQARKMLSVQLDDEGREWLFTDRGIYIYGTEFFCDTKYNDMVSIGKYVFLSSYEGKFAYYLKGTKCPIEIQLPPEITEIHSLLRSGDNHVLLSTDQGIGLYTINTHKFTLIPVQNPNQPSAHVVKLFQDSKKRIWVFTQGNGITLLDPKTWHTRWMTADVEDSKLRTTSRVPFIMEDEHGTIWCIPNNGSFAYYNEEKGELEAFPLVTYSYNDAKVIPYIDKYFISDQKILWVTGHCNLMQLNFKYHNFYVGHYSGEKDMKTLLKDGSSYWGGYSDGSVSNLSLNEKGRASRLDFLNQGGSFQNQHTTFSNGAAITALEKDKNGKIWIATDGDGLYTYNNGQIQHYTHNDSKSSLNSNKVQSLEVDRDGKVWVGTNRGINLVKEDASGVSFLNTENFFTSYPKNQFQFVRRIISYRNEIRLATTDGLVAFKNDIRNPNQIRYFISQHIKKPHCTSLSADDIADIFTASDGKTYISEIGGAIEMYNGNSLLKDNIQVETLKQFNPEGGTAQGIIEDGDGNIWVIRESSINRFNPQTKEVNVFGPNDFDSNLNFTTCTPYYDAKDNRISVGMKGGAFSFQPGKFTKTNYVPKIIFTYATHPGTDAPTPILHTPLLDIPSDKRNVAIHFASLDYSRNYQMKYAYQLDDGKWEQLGSTHNVSFNDFPYGEHTLRVKATNTHGVWAGNNITELKIYAHPTFSESIWGKMFYVGILLSLIFIGVHLYNVRQRAKLDHNISKMKSEFYSDMSHKIRTPLSLIGGPVGEVLRTETLSEKGKMLLQMVKNNSSNMLDIVNKMLKYDNDNFTMGDGYTNDVFANQDTEGITDENAGEYLRNIEESTIEEENEESKSTSILIVDDNPELRAFLYSILHKDYNILQAENGAIGLEKTKQEMPDFILTDITMPVMDGLEMVHRIKQDPDIAHIPIIILSARASIEDQNQGIAEGVMGYITKPFSATYLRGRIKNVLMQQQMYQQNVLKMIQEKEDADTMTTTVRPIVVTSSPVDINSQISEQQESLEIANPKQEEDTQQKQDGVDPVIRQVIDYVKENMANPSLKIDDIAMEVGMSRSVLYSKIKTETGMTPVDLVRHIRLLRAQKLIKNSNETLSQIAYGVGFSDPKYFSKVFKKEVGMTPSEYRDKEDEEES